MTKFSVPEMSCGHCKATIEKAVAEIDPGAKLQFDMDARKVDIEASVDTTAILAALKDAGYEASPAS
jgi:copper chaperone